MPCSGNFLSIMTLSATNTSSASSSRESTFVCCCFSPPSSAFCGCTCRCVVCCQTCTADSDSCDPDSCGDWSWIVDRGWDGLLATGEANGGELGSLHDDESCSTVCGIDSVLVLVSLVLLPEGSPLSLTGASCFVLGETLLSIPTALGRRTVAVSSCSRSWRRRSRAESVNDDDEIGCCCCRWGGETTSPPNAGRVVVVVVCGSSTTVESSSLSLDCSFALCPIVSRRSQASPM